MDSSKRKFFGSFGAMAAAPIAGIAAAMGVRNKLPMPEPAVPGAMITTTWWNNQIATIYKAIQESRR